MTMNELKAETRGLIMNMLSELDGELVGSEVESDRFTAIAGMAESIGITINSSDAIDWDEGL
jgi:hypothetical protein